MKLSTLTWIDEHVFDRISHRLFKISFWFLDKGHIKISDAIDEIEYKIGHKWRNYKRKQGWKPKPMSETSKRILKASLGSYLDCVKKGI